RPGLRRGGPHRLARRLLPARHRLARAAAITPLRQRWPAPLSPLPPAQWGRYGRAEQAFRKREPPMAVIDAAEQQREQLNTGTKEVAESHRFDEAALEAWMKANVEGYAGPLEVRQFKGGQSNPTYQLVTPAKKYVMRRNPPGK